MITPSGNIKFPVQSIILENTIYLYSNYQTYRNSSYKSNKKDLTWISFRNETRLVVVTIPKVSAMETVVKIHSNRCMIYEGIGVEAGSIWLYGRAINMTTSKFKICRQFSIS